MMAVMQKNYDEYTKTQKDKVAQAEVEKNVT
jgi:hypothetical protein